LLVLAPLAGAGCSSWPGFDRPHAEAGAYVAFYQLNGRVQMQSDTPQGIQDNLGMRLEQFGLDERDDDVGGFLNIGDGFSGLDVDYLKVTMKNAAPGPLSEGFGVLQPGDLVTTKMELDEWRARYVASILDHTFRDGPRLEFGIGAAMAHRDLEFFPKRATGEGQILTAKDAGVPYLAARLRGSYGAVSLDLDWAWNDGFDLGGDFEGRLQDVELTGRYDFPGQDVMLFVGYRFSELPAKGHEGPLAYRADFRLEGYLVGLQLRF